MLMVTFLSIHQAIFQEPAWRFFKSNIPRLSVNTSATFYSNRGKNKIGCEEGSMVLLSLCI